MKREAPTGSSTTDRAKRRRSVSKITYREDSISMSEGEEELEEDVKPVIKKEAKKEVKKEVKKRQPKKGMNPGDWTPAKRATFVDKVFNAGYKSLNLDEVAKEVSPLMPEATAYPQLNLNKRQLINQLTSGRSGNFRDKCVKHIKGDE